MPSFLIGHAQFKDQKKVLCRVPPRGEGCEPNGSYLRGKNATMSGLMEILLIAVIVLAIFLLPGLMGAQRKKAPQRADRILRLSGRKRLAIVASLLWPALLALYMKPWNGHWPIFLYTALGPVVLGWGIAWVLSGFRKGGK